MLHSVCLRWQWNMFENTDNGNALVNGTSKQNKVLKLYVKLHTIAECRSVFGKWNIKTKQSA